MNSDVPRFWPPNPGRQPEGSQPEEILRAAADELGPATGNEVVAEVMTRVDGEWLLHQFYLVSEKVGYRYLLFRARHRLGFPVTLFDRPEGPETEECGTAEELERALKQLFEQPVTQRIVGQLRNLSRDLSDVAS